MRWLSMIANKDKFDVAWACDTDHDRHGIVTRTTGLLNPNHYLAVSIQYLFTHRPEWSAKVGIGKTLVSSSASSIAWPRAWAGQCWKCRWASSGLWMG